MKMREAFNFYRSYYEVLKDIRRDEDKLTYLLALLERQFNGIEPELDDIPKLVYNSQKHSIDKQIKGWEDKTKTTLKPPTEHPTQPPKQDPTEPPYLQEQEQEKGKPFSCNEIIVETKIHKTPFDIDYTSLGGYGKFLQTFPLTKHREIDLGKQIWDTFSQEEKQAVMRHSTMYVKDMISKKQEMYLKNTFTYLESGMWLDMKARPFNKKPVERGMINMAFIKFFSIMGEITEDEAKSYLYHESTDDEFTKAHKIYKEHMNELLKQK
jgi:hypothetical protein